MKTINLDRYIPELSALYSFYRYSEVAFKDDGIREKIKEQEFETLFATAKPYLKVDPETAKVSFQRAIHEKVTKEIEGGLPILRRQILEASHSIFEKFLCHVVRVYLHTFPEILMDIDKEVSFRTIVEIRDNAAIFDHVVEKEVDHFSRRNWQQKKDYLRKRLKQTQQELVWTGKGDELWKDIDKKRQAIVHQEEIPEISLEYLLQAIYHLQGIMIRMAIVAQGDQGIKYSWAELSDNTVSKETPTLKS
jgi:hypothetical protein